MKKFAIILILFTLNSYCQTGLGTVNPGWVNTGWINTDLVNTGSVTREWVKRYNGPGNRFDIATTLRVDESSNVFVYGNGTSLITQSDIIALKYSASGDLLWQASFSGYGSSVDDCKAALLDDNGNSFITGFTADTQQVIKIVTIKIDNSGNVNWSRVFLPPAYNQGIGISITKDGSGNIYSCGSVRRPNGSNSIAIIKYSSNGTLTDSVFFNKTLTSSETPVSVCADNSGNVYVLASSNAVGGANDILMLKYSGSLSLIWQSTFSGNSFGNDMPVEMMISNDNKLVVAAAMNNAASGLDYGVFRFDTSSVLIMAYSYNGTGNNQDIPYAVTCDTANNVFVTGSSRNSDTLGSEDFYTMKIDPTSFLLWEKRYNGTGNGSDYGASIDVDRRGNVFVGGTTDKNYFRQQYALLKYSSAGELEWAQEYSKIDHSEDFIYTTKADNHGSIYVTGISFDSTSDYDIATIKYSEPIGIQPVSSEIPNDFKLYQNYPNPFNPVTKIRFDIPQDAGRETLNVRVAIYDVKGELVSVIVNRPLSSGTYEVEFDGSDLSSGIYYYNIMYGIKNLSKKMVLIK